MPLPVLCYCWLEAPLNKLTQSTPILMAMAVKLINAGGPGMGIRVKLINNYMSIAPMRFRQKPPFLCESS